MLRRFLPYCLNKRLFGDRRRFGLIKNKTDPDWLEWEANWEKFYFANQRSGIGRTVNLAGYRIMRDIDLSGMTVLEVGPGDIRHSDHWRTKPDRYLIADIRSNLLDVAATSLIATGVSYERILLPADVESPRFPFPDNSVDVVVSFYALEHIYPLDIYLRELKRVLKPNGTLVGAIPAEGGLAWGLGRFLTSRRWFKRNTTINPDKLICWEHPNFSDQILMDLNRTFAQVRVKHWPLKIKSLDLNLVVSFVYRNQKS